jgi:hypothetical protein
MSFEGYERILCENGHLFEYNVYSSVNLDEWKCPYCHKKAAWSQIVDETNGAWCSECNPECKDDVPGCEWCDHGRVDGYIKLEISQPAKRKVCECCGAVSIESEETYKIPNDRHRIRRKK